MNKKIVNKKGYLFKTTWMWQTPFDYKTYTLNKLPQSYISFHAEDKILQRIA